MPHLEEIKLNQILNGLKINAQCVNFRKHRHMASYDLKLELGSRIRKIELYSREIGLALKSKTNPIITPIPEEGIVRLRVASQQAETIYFQDLFRSAQAPPGILPFLLGEMDTGEQMWMDMALNPHLLVAGGTGSGKSTFLHLLIANALRRNDTWIYLMDPKGVEFSGYQQRVNRVSTTYEDAIYILDQIYFEMEKRYRIMRRAGVRSIEENPNIFPKCLIIIDEVSDLMMQDADKSNSRRGTFEKLLVSLAQKARAAGIYIVLATQRPSVDVITGLIKANFPARLACKVSSNTDSKVVLDQSGAESLLGRGDAILNNYNNHYSRFQVAYLDPKDA